MTYVITNLCTNDGACVEVCPVSCIHTREGAPQFYVDPEICIECEQCEIVCPVDAIFIDSEVPAEHQSAIDVNAAFFRENKEAAAPVCFDKAWEIVQAAHAHAVHEGIRISAAVVDEAGTPIAIGRMNDADPKSSDLALYKAYTAAAFDLSTADLRPLTRERWLQSLVVSHRGRILPEGGGLAIINGVDLVGAVGVAGGRPEQDILCCQAALNVLND